MDKQDKHREFRPETEVQRRASKVRPRSGEGAASAFEVLTELERDYAWLASRVADREGSPRSEDPPGRTGSAFAAMSLPAPEDDES